MQGNIIDSIRRVFSDGNSTIVCGGTGIYLPEYNIMVMAYPSTTAHGVCGPVMGVGSIAIPPYTIVQVSSHDDPHEALREVFIAIHRKPVHHLHPVPICHITKLPIELLLEIIKRVRQGNKGDLKQLRALTLSCKTIMGVMRIHREKIIAHYIVYRNVSNGWLVDSTAFCGRLHSMNDQPSITYGDNQLEWHQFGEFHRVNGPAYISPDGRCQMWYRRGRLHREGDEPAVIDNDAKYWLHNGKYWRIHDLPVFIDADGTQSWYRVGRQKCLHRKSDKPAVIRADGTQMWYKNGKRHRAKGKPAVIYIDGRPAEYWVNDVMTGISA